MALPVSVDAVKAVCPEFNAVANSVVQAYIDMADSEISEDDWGSRASRAEIVLTAHLMTVAGVLNSSSQTGGNVTGPVSSVSVGDVSVTYAATSSLAIQIQNLDASLASTKYGQEYARLVKLAAQGMSLADY